MTNLTVSKLSKQLLEIRIPYSSSSETTTFFLASDIHLDNPKCDRALFAKHMNQMRDRNGYAIFMGDILCLMQGKKDRRGSKGSIRPEHLGSNYFDLVFQESAEWLKPWGDRILMMGDGNHETAVISNQEVDPLGNVARIMRGNGSPVEHMGYQGFVRFVFHKKDGGRVRRCTLFWHHGAWGGIVTKGVMGGLRYSAMAPSANIICSGHNHEKTIVTHPCYRVSENGEVSIEQRLHVQCGTYKQEFEDGGGWAVERIVMPKSLGGIWLTLRPKQSAGVEIIATPASSEVD
jgi:hypothetical protein